MCKGSVANLGPAITVHSVSFRNSMTTSTGFATIVHGKPKLLHSFGIGLRQSADKGVQQLCELATRQGAKPGKVVSTRPGPREAIP